MPLTSTHEITVLAIKDVLDNLPSVQRGSKELYFYASVLPVPFYIYCMYPILEPKLSQVIYFKSNHI